MARWTRKDDFRFFAQRALELEKRARSAGRDDLADIADHANSDFQNALECLLSSSVADKRSGGGGSSEGWALRREAKGFIDRGHNRMKEVQTALEPPSETPS
mgnify:CR=1 FL=1